MAEAVKKEYEASLADLTFNSKPLINMLTMLAEENVKHARQIVQVIETRLQKAKPSEKLPILYLTDSIIKNMRGAYLEAFTPNIISTFCGVFEKVDEKTRQALFKLRMTWSSYFSPKKLYALDLKVQELDPAWPIVADPAASQPAAIHVNPKFIKKPAEAPKTTTPSVSEPTTSTSSTKVSALELAEQKKKESERQEMEMRQQLIKKQEQLLQLQQKRLEFELQQTQSKLAEQAMELKHKNEELLRQQQALQQQQQQAAAAAQQQQQQQQAAAAAAAAATWSGVMPPPPQPPMMWPGGPPGPPVITGHEASMMQQMNSQQQGFLPPPPMPPFNLGQPPAVQQQQQQMPPMQPVLPVQQVPPVPQGTAPVTRDPRVARDPRLARRDPRLRGAPELSVSTPVSTAQSALAVATVPPVQTTAQTPLVSVAPPQSMPPATSTKTAPSVTSQQLKSIVTVTSSQSSITTSKSPVQEASVPQVAKTSDSKQHPGEKRESKTEAKTNEEDTTSEKKKTDSKASEPKLDTKVKVEGEDKLNKSKDTKDTKSNERSPRRGSDEGRDVRSDGKSRDRSAREPERRPIKDSKKETDKRDAWFSRDRDSRERDRDYRSKDRMGATRETSRPVNSRRRSNRSRSRSRSPVSRRSYSPRSDKSRSSGTKVDKFGRDMPRPVKENKEEKKVEPPRKKDIDERPKARRGSKENVQDIEDDKVPKTEKRPSPSKMPGKETESKTIEEAPSKRRRLDEETPAKKNAPPSSPPKSLPQQEQEILSENKPEKGEPVRPKKSAEGLSSLMELSPLHPVAKPGMGRDRLHSWDRVEYEREMLSPGGRRERPFLRRRLSIDPNIHIPKELSLEKHAFILEQAEKQLHSGELTHQQHQELLRELFELHEIQRQRRDEDTKRHPHDPHLRRHYLDDPRMGYDPRRRLDPRKEGSWAQEKDIDRRKFPAQDIDMRVFDHGHPVQSSTGKTSNEHPEVKPDPEEITLPTEDKDERTRNPVHQDRDDRVRVPPNQNETKLPVPPLKSILKSRKNVTLESPLSPEPSEKCGNDSKVKTDGVESTKSEEKEKEDHNIKEQSVIAEDNKSSPVSDSPEDGLAEDSHSEGVDHQSVEKSKGKKKTKKKKKKGKGSEAEVLVQVSAFEENLQIKPPVFNEKKKQPLMDMDERRNSTDNETGHMLPAPFREADDIGDLFPSGGDRDERRGHESSGDSSKEAHPPSPERKVHNGGRSRESIAVSAQIKEPHPRDPRVCKGPADMEHGPSEDGYHEGFPERNRSKEAMPNHPYRGRHPNELPSREGIFREPLPRDSAFHEGSPREGFVRDRPLRSPTRETELWADREHRPREGPDQDVSLREGIHRDGPSREDPFRDGPPRVRGHFRDRVREGPFREGPPREGPFADGPRGGPFRNSPMDGLFRDGPQREVPFRDDPLKEGPFRDHPPLERPLRDGRPREGPFRDGPLREGSFRDGSPGEDPFREGPSRDGPFREGPPREGPFRDGPPKEGPFRDGPPRDRPSREFQFRDSPPREGPFRGLSRKGPFRGPPREGPFREGPFREGPSREGPFREGPPREGPFREGPQREGPFREGPPREGPFREGPPREGPFREGPQREGPYREGPPREGPYREGPPREGSFREGPPMEGQFRDGVREGSFKKAAFRKGHPREDPRGHSRDPYREENEFFREGHQRNRPFREGLVREEPFWDDHPQDGYGRGSPPRKGHFRDFSHEEPLRDAPSEVRLRSPPREQFRGPPRLVPSDDLRDGPTQDLRKRRFPVTLDEAGPRPMMEHRLIKGLPSHERFSEEQKGMPTPPELAKQPVMGDKDERHPIQFDERASVHHPQPISDIQNMEVALPPPYLQVPHLPSVNPISNPGHPIPGMPNLTMVPVQTLPQVSDVRHLPPGTILQGTELPPTMSRAHLVNVSQPGQVLVLSGQQRPVFLPEVPSVPHHLPPGVQPLIRPGLAVHHQFDSSGIPGLQGFTQMLPVTSGMSNPVLHSAPHLRPENPQGTPPQQQAGPLDINSLFAKLVATGILPPTRSDSPALPQCIGTPPLPTSVPELAEPEELVPGDDFFVPEIGLYPEELKCRYEGVINRIYTGAQCSSCGMRFVVDEMDRYRKHLDWHFRQNRRDKDGVKAVQNRKWFFTADEWLDFEEINDMIEERSNFFEEQALQSQVDKDGIQCVAVDANVEGDEMCSLCHEPFEQFFDEDEEVWKLKDALRFSNRTYHPSCYEDAKESALLETPTPGEEGLNSSFESSLMSPLSAHTQRKAAETGQTTSLEPSPKEKPKEPVTLTNEKLESGNRTEDGKNDLNSPSKDSALGADQPKADTNQEAPSTKLGLASTDQSVDPQKDTRCLSTELPAGTQPGDTKTEMADSAPGFKLEISAAFQPKSLPDTDQPMETSANAEIHKSVKQEETAGDAKSETPVCPPVKMEVDKSTIAEVTGQSQDLAPEDKMEVCVPVPVKQESESIDREQPMDTSIPLSSETETKLKSDVGEIDSAPSSEQLPDCTTSESLLPTSNSKEVATHEQTDHEAIAPECSQTDLAKVEAETVVVDPKPMVASSEMEKEDGATSSGLEVQGTSSQQPTQAESEITPEAERSQSETKETEADSQQDSNLEAKPCQETPKDGDSKSTSTTTAAETSEVQNIQAISVIGRSRLDTRRRDMFFR